MTGPLVWILRAYKRYASPMLPRSCRFAPTCSEYSSLALKKYGVIKGVAFGLWRLVRCHPFGPGGIDIP